MYKKLLQKCIDELGKTDVDLSYLRGILETLVEIEPEAQTSVVTSAFLPKPQAQAFGAVVPGGVAKMQPVDSLSPEEQAVMAAMDSLQSGITPGGSVVTETNINLN